MNLERSQKGSIYLLHRRFGGIEAKTVRVYVENKFTIFSGLTVSLIIFDLYFHF